MLKQILTPFLLRRLKSDVTLEVPPKKEIVVYAPLTAKQESFYRAIVDRTIATMLGKERVKHRFIFFCHCHCEVIIQSSPFNLIVE